MGDTAPLDTIVFKRDIIRSLAASRGVWGAATICRLTTATKSRIMQCIQGSVHQSQRPCPMPTLENPRYEASAKACAKSALLIDAYESAGFVRHRGHPNRLALKNEVAEGLAEVRALQTNMEHVGHVGMLASLRRIIKAGEGWEKPALVNTARPAILDASRLHAALVDRQVYERGHLDKVFNAIAAEQAADEAPKRAVERPSPPPKAPAAAPAAPVQRPVVAPRAPLNLLASAATSPQALPGPPPLPTA